MLGRCDFSHSESCVLTSSSQAIAKHTSFNGFFGLTHHVGRGGFFHSESCVFISPKPPYCQTDKFQQLFEG